MTPTTVAEDRLGIQTLYSRYNWHLDIGDTEGVLALFPSGSTIIQPGEEGPSVADTADAVRAVVEGWHADPSLRGRQHHVTNLVIGPDPEGRDAHRSARTSFIVTDGAGAPPSQLVWCGYSDDVVARDGDEWHFVVRNVALWSAEVAERFRKEAVASRP